MKNTANKKKNELQIGNYILTRDNGILKAIKITSVAGNWNIRFREDHPLYSWIQKELKSDEGKEILHLTFACWYAATNGIPDKAFLNDVVQAYTRSVDRIKEGIKNLSDEEDQEILNEMNKNV